MTYVITEPCIGVKDASCVEVCPVDCIHSDDDAPQYFINPDEWKHFVEANAGYFKS